MGTMNGYLLPEDVIIEILSWLPVIILLQLRCVCKSWNEIIISSDFISKHLNNYYNNNTGCLLACCRQTFDTIEWCGLFLDKTLEDLTHHTLDLPIPESTLDGPCNGLYYVESRFFLRDCGLWNPATKEFKLLPAKLTKSNLPPEIEYSYHVSGFGLDPVTNDYKVVVIHYLADRQRCEAYLPSQVIVYTLGTDSWRYWGDLAPDYFLRDSRCYMHMNGIYYWLASYVVEGNKSKDMWKLHFFEMRKVIVSFDMATEEFQEIPIAEEMQDPDYDDPNFRYSTFETLALYHDSIAFFVVEQIEKILDIWVINDGLWVKKFSSVSFMGIRNPVGYWKNDEVFVEFDTEELMLVDPSTQEIKSIPLGGRLSDVFIHKDSLVPIWIEETRQNEKHLTEYCK